MAVKAITPRVRNAAYEPTLAPHDTLTTDERRFIIEYFRTLNAGKAFATTWPGVPDAASKARSLLRRADMVEACEDWRRRAAVRFGLTRDRVMQEYARIAFFDPRNLYHPDGTVKLPVDLDDDTAAGVTGYETVQTKGPAGEEATAVRVKWGDKLRALDALMKAQGWNEEKTPGTEDNPIVLVLQEMAARSAIMPVQHVPKVIDQADDE